MRANFNNSIYDGIFEELKWRLIMPYLITSLTAESNYKLRLIYSNGSEIIVDFQPIINQGGVFTPLFNPNFFSQVKLGEDGRYIECNGGIDFCELSCMV